MKHDWLTVTEGNSPVLLSIPHTGTQIPDDVAAQLSCTVEQALADTDWWVEKLYDFAAQQDITVVRTDISRTVIDMNRDPSGHSLYPGQTTTGLCPLERFDGMKYYENEPDETEIARRQQAYHAPYHQAIDAQLARLRGQHEKVVLFDAHSIRSVCPRLFDGELPGLNIGTNSGNSCDDSLAQLTSDTLSAAGYSMVTNGRFKGGWITRHYGNPDNQIHAIQLETAQRCYLNEPESPGRPVYDATVAASLKHHLQTLFSQIKHWARS